jgi:hypothetical protein
MVCRLSREEVKRFEWDWNFSSCTLFIICPRHLEGFRETQSICDRLWLTSGDQWNTEYFWQTVVNQRWSVKHKISPKVGLQFRINAADRRDVFNPSTSQWSLKLVNFCLQTTAIHGTASAWFFYRPERKIRALKPLKEKSNLSCHGCLIRLFADFSR